MRMKSVHIAALLLIFIFGGIGVSASLGWWKTTTDKIPDKFAEGVAQGEYNPADIKGSYTFGDIEKTFGIPASDLATAFGLPNAENAASFPVKDLETLYADLAASGTEIGTGSVRYFVALFKGLPFETDEATYLPDTAVKLLNEKASLTDAQKKALESISVSLKTVEAPTASTTVSSNEPVKTPGTIKGSTTFQEILDWGLSKADIESVMGSPMPDPGKTIKTHAEEKGVEFSTWKDALQELIE